MFKAIRDRFQEMVSYRHFMAVAVRKEFKSRYTQSLLGAAWLLLEPLLLVATFTIIFTLLGRKGPEGVPFPVFFYSGVLAWNLFAANLNRGSQIFVSDKALISKVNFPREIIAIKNQAVFIIDYLFAAVAFVAILAWARMAPNWYYLYVPLLLILQIVFGMGLMLIFGTIHVFLRDVGILAKSLVTVWFWFTPILFEYPFSGSTKILYYLNPMAGVIYGYHKIFIYGEAPSWEALISILVAAPLTLFLGYWMFLKKERLFADVI